VVTFAFGEELTIWPFTNFGWLKIVNPAKEYEHIYLGMQEAVKLWYYIDDNKEEPWNVKDWAKGFESFNHGAGMSFDQALAALAMHADFILPQMRRKVSVWSRTKIFEFMKFHAPFSEESRRQGKMVTSLSGVAAAAPKSGTPDTVKKRGRPKKVQGTEVISRVPSEEEKVPKEVELLRNQRTDAAIVWKLISAKSQAWTLDEASKLVYAHFQINSIPTAGHYLIYQAESLLKYMRRGQACTIIAVHRAVKGDDTSQGGRKNGRHRPQGKGRCNFQVSSRRY
jgi:hypothetical protein